MNTEIIADMSVTIINRDSVCVCVSVCMHYIKVVDFFYPLCRVGSRADSSVSLKEDR